MCEGSMDGRSSQQVDLNKYDYSVDPYVDHEELQDYIEFRQRQGWEACRILPCEPNRNTGRDVVTLLWRREKGSEQASKQVPTMTSAESTSEGSIPSIQKLSEHLGGNVLSAEPPKT